MMRAALVLALVSFLSAPAGGAEEAIQVSSLVRDGHVLVSFKLDNGFNDEVRESIRSGLETTITYQVELRRTVAGWFDQTLAVATVSATARYDNLTRLHQLSRTIDGRGEEPRVSAEQGEVRAWMTEFDRLALFSTSLLEPNREYYVRVRARTRPRLAWFFWPWDRGGASGRATFTFIL